MSLAEKHRDVSRDDIMSLAAMRAVRASSILRIGDNMIKYTVVYKYETAKNGEVL